MVDEIIEDLDNFMIQAGLDPTELEEIHEGFEFVSLNPLALFFELNFLFNLSTSYLSNITEN